MPDMDELGYRFAHLGINQDNPEAAAQLAQQMKTLFGFPSFDVGGSIFVTGQIEVMKTIFRGKNGHIAIETSNLELAIADMEKRGIELDMDTLQKGDDNRPISVYLADEKGGIAFHLLQKQS